MQYAPPLFISDLPIKNNMRPKKAATVHPTLVAPHPDSIPNLTSWRRPKTAYVLLEFPQCNIISDGEFEWGMGLCTVNAESRAEVIGNVENILNKGGRILDYGNFPKLNDPNPQRHDKAMIYSGGKVNSWDALEKFVKNRMAGDMGWRDEKAEMEQEINALKAKVAEQNNRKAVSAASPAKEA